MNIIKNKRGIIFTFIAVLVVLIVAVMFSIDTSPPSRERNIVVTDRVYVADDYIKNLEDTYIKRALFVTSYASLEALALYINKTDFLTNEKDLNSRFKEILLNGSVYGVNVDTQIGRNIMNGKTFLVKLEEIQNASMDFLHIKTNFTKDTSKINVTIYQDNTTGPFIIKVNISFEYFVDAELATWNRTVNTYFDFSIEGIDDPVYLHESDMSHPFRISNLTSWDMWTVRAFISNGMYRYENKSASFLMKFYNGQTPSECCGIQSIVPAEVSAATGEKDRSYVDCDFISDYCAPVPGYDTYYNITGITNSTYHFKLDEYYLARYNLSAYAIET